MTPNVCSLREIYQWQACGINGRGYKYYIFDEMYDV